MHCIISLLIVTLTFCVAKVSAADDASQLSEQVINNADIFQGDQLAPMLPMNDGSVLVFRNYGGRALIIHLWPNSPQKQTSEALAGFEVPYHATAWRPDVRYQASYASISTSAGIWLIGATIELIRPDKSHLSGKLNRPRNYPKVAALPDGSILVVGSENWDAVLPERSDINAPNQRSVERVSFSSDGHIVSEYVAPVPSCRPVKCLWENLGGFSMVHLGEGRVMLAGGGNDMTYIYDSVTRNWQFSAQMNEYRSGFSLSVLPDGRVMAAGGNDTYPKYRSNMGMSTEIWDPKTEQWSTGPPLPVPIAEHTALLVNRTVILAGGRFAGVLAWDIDDAQWRIAAQLEIARNRAGVVYLGDSKLAILGGLHARTYEEAWGRRTAGYSLVNIPREAIRHGTPVGLAARNHAVATRGSLVFIAGGMFTSTYDGSVDEKAISNVELFDEANNTVRSLPPLPFGASSASAFWVDDHRLLVLAYEYDRSITPRWIIFYDVASEYQSSMVLPSESTTSPMTKLNYLSASMVAGVRDERVFVNLGSEILGFLDFSKKTFSPGYNVSRSGFILNILANGKAIMAGGTEGSHIVLARVDKCNTCSERYIEYGGTLPFSTYEIFDLETRKRLTSAPSTAFGGPLTIFSDGRVAKLGKFTEPAINLSDRSASAEKTSTLLELSDVDGTHWHTVSLPSPLQIKNGGVGIRLLSVKDPISMLEDVLFIGGLEDSGRKNWWWIDLKNITPKWQQLDPPQSAIGFNPSKIDFGQLRITEHTVRLIESGDGFTVFAEELEKK